MERVDKLLSEKLEISRSDSKKIIEQCLVKYNGQNIKSNLKISEEDFEKLEIDEKYKEYLITDNEKPEISEKELNSIEILYEDDHIYIINKPINLIVESETTKENTLVDILKKKNMILSKSENRKRDGIVHRLDKDTSGLLIITKTIEANEKFTEMFKKQEITKIYLTIVKGQVEKDKAIIDMPIERNANNRTKMIVSKEGKKAVSRFEVLERFKEYTFLKVQIYTGRTHQIRVHLSQIGHSIVGDDKYGGGNNIGVKRPMLHAYMLEFKHPITGKDISVKADVPNDIKNMLEFLEKNNSI